MFKKISCVALGAVAMSLVSAVEPAQALSFRSSPTSSSLNSFSSQPTSFGQSFSGQASGFGQSSFDSSSPSLLSQLPADSSIGGGGVAGTEVGMILSLLFAIALGMDTTGGGGERMVVLGEEIVNPDDDPTPVPTPALLPGLFGMGIAAIRKRNNQAQANQA